MDMIVGDLNLAVDRNLRGQNHSGVRFPFFCFLARGWLGAGMIIVEKGYATIYKI